MLFCTQQYLIFFSVIFAAYWLMPWQRARVWLLLGASIYFYAAWNKWLALVVVASSCGDYLLARGMDALESPRWRKFLVGISVVGNLGLLCYFKYANFFLRSLEDALHAAGASASLPVLQVILPVGISFYTFEAINYVVDVYRRKIPAERDPAKFLLFILFFPHLVAGPIVRAADFLPQIGRRMHWSWPRLHLGAQLFLLGLFKKLAVADRMAFYTDPVFADPGAFRTSALWIAAFAYAIQVYCDFSGYSDMAIGSAHALGYKLARNFNLPFLAANITEFYHRWHISLSTWIRDYVFFPLGGSRFGLLRTIRNILIAFTLCGLWHGASWNFVAWGFITAVALVAHRLFQLACRQQPSLQSALSTSGGTSFRIAITFVTFMLTLVVFRTQSLGHAATMLSHMAVPAPGHTTPLPALGFWLTVAVVAAAHIVGVDQHRWLGWWNRVPAPVRGFSYAWTLTLALVLSPDIDKAFIYFQF